MHSGRKRLEEAVLRSDSDWRLDVSNTDVLRLRQNE